jgi:hypothetical protein
LGRQSGEGGRKKRHDGDENIEQTHCGGVECKFSKTNVSGMPDSLLKYTNRKNEGLENERMNDTNKTEGRFLSRSHGDI